MTPKKKKCFGCGNVTVIWKNHEGNRYCKYCWNRTNQKHKSNDLLQKKSSKPTSRKPIASRSPKRAKQEREYLKKRKDFLYYHPLCQAKIPNICTTHATDVHHKQGRIGQLLTDETKFLAVCRQCHDWIETHPKEAKELGFSISKII